MLATAADFPLARRRGRRQPRLPTCRILVSYRSGVVHRKESAEYIGMSDIWSAGSSLVGFRTGYLLFPLFLAFMNIADRLQIAVREAKRQNAAYRLHAIPALGRVAAARTDKDMSDTVYEIIAPVLTETVEKEDADDNDAMDVDGASNGTASR